MKTIILAGGFGTRLSEFTEAIPKPMVPVGRYPIILHIMQIYSVQGFNEFIVALGYKGERIKSYFRNFHTDHDDFTVDLGSGNVRTAKATSNIHWAVDFQVTLVDTGYDTMTGGRIKKLRNYIQDETFLLTYGDGVCDVDIKASLEFHKSHGKLATMTAVHPPVRFGNVDIQKDRVVEFHEKSLKHGGWINGGYFVLEPEVLDYIDGDHISFEKEPMERLAREGQLMAFKHDDFWQCMDMKGDVEYLNRLWAAGEAPWKIW